MNRTLPLLLALSAAPLFAADPLPDGAIRRFGAYQPRHGDGISNAALSPDGKLLATAGKRSVIVWELPELRIRQRFWCEHGDTFSCPGLSFSPDSKRLGYVRGSGFAVIWDVGTGREVRRFDGERGFSSCGFTADGRQFALHFGDDVEFRDLATGERVGKAAAKDINLLSRDARSYVRIDEWKSIAVGDTWTGKETALDVKTAHNGSEDGVAFSPDGKMLAAIHDRRELQLRHVPDGTLRCAIPLGEFTFYGNFADSVGWAYSVHFTADGSAVLLCTDFGSVHRWDVTSGKELPVIDRAHKGHVTGAFRLPDGTTLLTTGSDGFIRRWDWQSGKLLSGIPAGEAVTAVTCASPDGRHIAVGNEWGRIDLFEADADRCICTFQKTGKPVRAALFSSDGRSLATGESGSVHLWDLSSGKLRRSIHRDDEAEDDVDTLSFSPDGRYLLSGGVSGLEVHDLKTGQSNWQAMRLERGVFSPHGRSVLAVLDGRLRSVFVMNTVTGEKEFGFPITSERWQRRRMPPPPVRALAISADGRRLAVAFPDGSVAIHNTRTGVEQIHFDASDGQPFSSRYYRNGPDPYRVETMAFSPDGLWLATGGSDWSIRIFDAASGDQALRLNGHEGTVTRVGFTPDGRKLLSSGEDGQVLLWDLFPSGAAADRDAAAWWNDLISDDAPTAYRAVWSVNGNARALVEHLRKELPAVKPADASWLSKKLAELDDRRFRARETASKLLAEKLDGAASALPTALRNIESVEVRGRIEKLLAELKREPTPADLRRTRAVEALSLSNTPEARDLLREWANGAAGARLTEEARAALRRIAGP